MTSVEVSDVFAASVARGAPGLLRAFNEAGILSTSDVHVALRLARLGATTDELARLGAAFAARAPRLGHVCVDLGTIAGTASSDADAAAVLGALPWPDPAHWLAAMARSPCVGDDLPLHLEGTNLYLDRMWADERRVASDLLERASGPVGGVDDAVLASGLAELFEGVDDPDFQRLAAATAVLRRVSVIAGGPGTGKTTTVARVLALLHAQAAGRGRPPLIALAAPTGKAAARLEEAVRQEAAEMPIGPEVRDRLSALQGTTLHRLLGSNPGNRTRFRHDRLNRLAHDVVVVDETSMVSLSMMARVVEAVRSDARLILVGDPEQLASIEAGAVLGDIVPPQSRQVCMSHAARERLAAVTGQKVPATDTRLQSPVGDGIVVLSKVHRFRGAIAKLAAAIQHGRADDALSVLRDGEPGVRWIASDCPPHTMAPEGLPEVRSLAVECGRAVREAALAGEAKNAVEALGRFRLLCAHRRGPGGVAMWMHQVEGWLRAEVDGFGGDDEWYVGRPLIVTENDYGLKLFNGDIGVVVAEGDRRVAAFDRGEDIVRVSPARLAAVDTVYAMTVHKSQGSQFHTVAFLVPGVESRVLTRELIYTAVTRAEERLILVGAEEPIRAAIERPITRASGLRRALWGAPAG